MKTRILVGIIVSSLLLTSCGKVPQTETPRPDATQNHVTGSTLSQQTSSSSGNEIAESSTGAELTKNETDDVPTAPFQETCDLLADNMRDPSISFDVELLKNCNLRAAIEAKDFKYCLNNAGVYADLWVKTEDGLRDCARTTMFRTIENLEERNEKTNSLP